MSIGSRDLSENLSKDNRATKSRNRINHTRNSGTHRFYPDRFRNAKKYNDEYIITVYKTQSDYDTHRQNEAVDIILKNGPDKQVNTIDFYAADIKYLWQYANRIFGLAIEKPGIAAFEDLTYQEFANITRCKIIVNKNFIFHYGKLANPDITFSHQTRNYGGGLPSYEYKQLGHGRYAKNNRGHTMDNPNNITVYVPNLSNGTIQKLDYVIEIQPPIDMNDYQLTIQMKKTPNAKSSICMGCFRHDGRMWMLEGIGNKSSGKTKGKIKKKSRNIKNRINEIL
jgi:hypothetical protein